MRNILLYAIFGGMCILLIIAIMLYGNPKSLTYETIGEWTINKVVDGRIDNYVMSNDSFCAENIIIEVDFILYKADDIEICGWLVNNIGHPYRGWVVGVDILEGEEDYVTYVGYGVGDGWNYVFSHPIDKNVRYSLKAVINGNRTSLFLNGILENSVEFSSVMKCASSMGPLIIGYNIPNIPDRPPQNHWVKTYIGDIEIKRGVYV